jgi:hypothetical protein
MDAGVACDPRSKACAAFTSRRGRECAQSVACGERQQKCGDERGWRPPPGLAPSVRAGSCGLVKSGRAIRAPATYDA